MVNPAVAKSAIDPVEPNTSEHSDPAPERLHPTPERLRPAPERLHSAKAKAAAAYNAAADRFDDPALGFWDRYGQATVDRLALRPGAAVLDVGCGSGASALPAAERVGPTGRVIGVDLAGGLLALARAKAARRGFDHVEFQVGDMASMRYAHARFDAVVCCFAIFFLSDMARQVGELWRLVKPGGQLAITTWGPRFLEPAAGFWWDEIRRVRPDLHASFNPWDRITSPDQVHQLLAEGGVPAATVVAEDGRQPLCRPEDWWTIVLGSGLRWTVTQLTPLGAARVRAANVGWARANRVTEVETNVIYATATKPAAPGAGADSCG